MKFTDDRRQRPVVKDRLSYFWLALAALLGLFGFGRWMISLAPWLGTMFMLRFVRTQKPGKGYLIGVLTSALVVSILCRGTIPVPPAAYPIFVAAAAAIGFVPFLTDRLLAPRIGGFASTLVLPLAWTTEEFLNGLTSPFGSWGSLAYTQFSNLPLMQLVSVTGLAGVTFLVIWFASVINWAWEREFDWQQVRFGITLYAGLLCLVTLLGGARLALFPPGAVVVRVASLTRQQEPRPAEIWKPLIAGGRLTGQERRACRTTYRAIHDNLFERSEREARAGAQIVLWPEGDAPVLKSDETALIDRGRRLARRHGIYLQMALFSLRPEGKKRLENKAVLIAPSGEIAYEYLKARPVPGPEEQNTLAGDGRIPTHDTPFGRLAPTICYDQDFPRFVRQAGRAGVDIVLSPAADWQEVMPLHTRMAIVRGIEQGFSVVRPARMGLSAAADCQGQLLATMDHYRSHDRVMVAQVPVKGVRTIYSRVGDLFAWLCVAGFVTILGGALLGQKRTLASQEQPRQPAAILPPRD